ncbi:MAG TPA: M14 family zinc carboxypeptidase, partial [Solirubrobacteraceae bacterium]
GFDVTEDRRANWVDVIVDGPAQLDTLRRLRQRFDVRIANLQDAYAASRRADARYGARVAGASPLPSGRTTYRTYTEIQDELKKVAADHPDTVRPLVIGKSFQGREIQGLEVANNVKGDDGRPVFFLMALHHAREWPSAEAAMEFAHLLTESSGDSRVQRILDTERVVIVPLVNPDGFISSRGAFDPGDEFTDQDPNATLVEAVAPPGGLFAYRRKNCDGAVAGGDFPCELQWGVDPNRNYGNLWGGNGSSQDPTTQIYKGTAPRSEPEVQAVWNYVRTHQVTNLITLHNVAALVLRPPGLHDGGKAPDEARMKEIGDAMANATGYTSEFGFQLYDTAGTTEDDTYTATGGYGYTIEIGPEGGNFHMPYETGVINEWTGNNDKAKNRGGLREALLLGAEAAGNQADHAQLTGTAPPGRVLRLSRSFDTKTSDYCLRGADPVVVGPSLPDFLRCPEGTQPALTLHDKLDSTTTVPAGGVYDWQINQSTRPFVGGGSLKETLADTPYRDPQTWDGEHVVRFDVTDQDATNAVRVNLDGAFPGEDYDLYVYRVNADGTRGEQVGSSAGSTGHEVVDLTTPPAGTYEAEVVDFTAVTDQFTLSEAPYEIKREVTTGHKEDYTLTCEDGQGNVRETHSLTIDRGQIVDLALGCGAGPTILPAAGPGPTPAVDGQPVVSGAKARAVQPSKSKAKAKAKRRKPTARRQRARCRSKAKRIKRRAKRRAALRRCEAAYRKAKKKRVRR